MLASSPLTSREHPAVVPLSLPYDLAVVAPTYNERENVAELHARLEEALAGRAWELIFVDDDSTDGTRDVVMALARQDARVRLVRRVGRRGLSTAVIEGALATCAPVVAVMDADLQHDERVLPAMIERLSADGCDLVVGSRYMEGGGVGEWKSVRRRMSALATRLSRLVTKARLSDPMSGFFVMRREAIERSVYRLSGQGYKILLDLLASSPEALKVGEVPYTFRNRLHGESKLDSAVLWEYGLLLADKLVGRIVPVRFLVFAFVGGLGLGVHFAVLTLAFRTLGVEFAIAQTAAAVAAMTFNFFVNNVLTYRDRRLKGFRALARGLASFYFVCSVGLVANIGIADYLFKESYAWWLSGIAGILVGAVWNYAASAALTWRK
jgi:dolichol-phosphate mannosyltransferase